ncbi:hypothetical protein BUALT_Bualt01G0152900 [Buddleja alternifolia]|uniref:Uncharacterized protein n=1 Tax=Buddleja alternifolia TaxID=168488 RepID=A0AAV6YF42_9LAMI|nr:hypothetical protein BUALT_Bualt01G0152900 [Buddleja alternifolia]
MPIGNNNIKESRDEVCRRFTSLSNYSKLLPSAVDVLEKDSCHQKRYFLINSNTELTLQGPPWTNYEETVKDLAELPVLQKEYSTPPTVAVLLELLKTNYIHSTSGIQSRKDERISKRSHGQGEEEVIFQNMEFFAYWIFSSGKEKFQPRASPEYLLPSMSKLRAPPVHDVATQWIFFAAAAAICVPMSHRRYSVVIAFLSCLIPWAACVSPSVSSSQNLAASLARISCESAVHLVQDFLFWRRRLDVTGNPIFNDEKVQKAIAFARKAHHGQIRKMGGPYLSHCIHTRKILAVLVPLNGKRGQEIVAAEEWDTSIENLQHCCLMLSEKL